MNDGTMAMIVEWTLLCVVWMGLTDRFLHHMGWKRSTALMVLTAFLITSYSEWRLFILPVEVNVSGMLLPLLIGGGLWYHLKKKRRKYMMTSAILMAFALILLRKLFFWDPVLLFIDEVMILPVLCVILCFIVTRHATYHWFLLCVAFPISDAFYQASFLSLTERCVIGGEYQQDLFWASFTLLSGCYLVIQLLQKAGMLLRTRIAPLIRFKSKSPTNR
ncbi:hypothetical protein O0555_02405 [Brevibacillus laterosporus]|uniref:YphA family membrane protein n=1 Tax=Brevibacillus laterosporus TaxID=1465 RepID=UPI0018CE1C17|nr:hypothetical protein [Brevibacillus laterosporus]MBG9797450.1 membrane protein [Brevibacillus laterosporus]MCR8936206.1 hypothetical protein [Brevibacillus laterosporus]MCZ0838845.1 hypothetical protein [Brevibacillus laterosporus]MCZ0844875.1 hypothetical protein [Brevibacillus laterosporus]MED1913014.1 hypothetical protein [Brevibacillus laterosporus]